MYITYTCHVSVTKNRFLVGYMSRYVGWTFLQCFQPGSKANDTRESAYFDVLYFIVLLLSGLIRMLQGSNAIPFSIVELTWNNKVYRTCDKQG